MEWSHHKLRALQAVTNEWLERCQTLFQKHILRDHRFRILLIVVSNKLAHVRPNNFVIECCAVPVENRSFRGCWHLIISISGRHR